MPAAAVISVKVISGMAETGTLEAKAGSDEDGVVPMGVDSNRKEMPATRRLTRMTTVRVRLMARPNMGSVTGVGLSS
jgi:hypothetical protein